METLVAVSMRSFEKIRKIPRKTSTVEPSVHEVAGKKLVTLLKKCSSMSIFPDVLRKFSVQISFRTSMTDCFYNLPDKLA